MNGFINLLKPPGMSSSDAVAVARKLTGQKKLGHSGTLDPLAAGVLPLCLGRATKLFDYLMEKEKEYLAELTLGFETDTQDADGAVIERGDPSGICRAEVESALEQFRGSILQQPPMYSALVHQGRKLYKMAREGQTIEREYREIDIHGLAIVEQTGEYSYLLRINCSKGTYIRTLAADIGRALGCYGCVTYLLRTASGRFTLANTVTIEELAELATQGRAGEALIAMDFPLEQFPRADCELQHGYKLLNGIAIPSTLPPAETVRVYVGGVFVGLGKVYGETTEPAADKNGGETTLRMRTTLLDWSSLNANLE